MQGLKDGKGKLVQPDGSNYSGEWKNDEWEGFGEEHWSDGANYVGNYIKGRKDGKGKMTFKDGSVYEGQFQQN